MANNKIKGIVVEIGGDTLDLQKSLQLVENHSKGLQQELRQVEKALKFNPGNTTLLAQQQELLQEQIKSTATELDTLKISQQQVEDKFQNGKISAEQYRAFQREVVQTESKLQSLKKKAEEIPSSISSINEIKLDKLQKEFEETTVKISEAKQKIKEDLKSVATVGAGALTGVGAMALNFGNFDSALNSLISQTGKVEPEQVNELQKALEGVYLGNYGDSLDEIATVIGKLVQQTGLIDGEKLTTYASNLFALRDTFDMDLNETLRGVQNLSNNMGVGYEQAFNLFTVAAQNGLNYTDELGDNVAEYSQLWGQAGFSAQEMFAILENGVKNGAYNLDKVNDFVKEFAISLNDGRMEENLESFSDNTQNLFKEFKNGKKTARDVFRSVVDDLNKTENEQEALTTASTVWSALGEDNALKVIKSLTKVNGNYKIIENSMDKINEIKYDDIQNKLSTLRRKAETELLNPFIEKIYPDLEKGVDWLCDNLDDLIPILEGVARQIGIIYGAKKANDLVGGIADLVGGYQTLKNATLQAKGAQELLNLAQNSNVVGLIVMGLGTIANIYTTLKENYPGLKTEQELIAEKLQETTSKVNEQSEALKQHKKHNKEDCTAIESSYGYYSKLVGELEKLVGKNGEVKKGDKDRVDFIISTLNGTLDTQINKEKLLSDKKQDVIDKIKEQIDLEKSQAKIKVYEDDYNEAIKNVKSYTDTVIEAQKNVDEMQKAYDTAQANYGSAYERFRNGDENYIQEASKFILAKQNLQNAQQTLTEAQNNLSQVNSLIANYEYTMEKSLAGESEAVKTGLAMLETGFQSANTASENQLFEQVTRTQNYYKNLAQAHKEGQSGVTQEMVDNAKTINKKAVAEYQKSQQQSQQQMDESLKQQETKNKEALEKSRKATEEQQKQAEAKHKKALDIFKKTTNDQIETFSTSIDNAFKKASTTKNATTTKLGENAVDGYVNGFAKRVMAVKNVIKSWTKTLIGWVTGGIAEAQDSHSPSKVAEKLGKDFADGYPLGLQNNTKPVAKAAKQLVSTATSTVEHFTPPQTGQRVNTNNNYTNDINININATVENDTDFDILANRISRKLANEYLTKGARKG